MDLLLELHILERLIWQYLSLIRTYLADKFLAFFYSDNCIQGRWGVICWLYNHVVFGCIYRHRVIVFALEIRINSIARVNCRIKLLKASSLLIIYVILDFRVQEKTVVCGLKLLWLECLASILIIDVKPFASLTFRWWYLVEMSFPIHRLLV